MQGFYLASPPVIISGALNCPLDEQVVLQLERDREFILKTFKTGWGWFSSPLSSTVICFRLEGNLALMMLISTTNTSIHQNSNQHISKRVIFKNCHLESSNVHVTEVKINIISRGWCSLAFFLLCHLFNFFSLPVNTLDSNYMLEGGEKGTFRRSQQEHIISR